MPRITASGPTFSVVLAEHFSCHPTLELSLEADEFEAAHKQAEGLDVSDDEKVLKNLQNLTLAEIATRRGNPIDGGVHAYLDAEITRRTAEAQIHAARYMKLSVIAIAVTSGLTAFVAIASWLWPNPLHFH